VELKELYGDELMGVMTDKPSLLKNFMNSSKNDRHSINQVWIKFCFICTKSLQLVAVGYDINLRNFK